MVEPKILFERWFVQPLARLRELPNGDGGFIALATSCFLYERYAVAAIKRSGGKANKEGKIGQFMGDFEVDEGTARQFWDVIRDGILHQGMPKANENDDSSSPNWAFVSINKPVQMGKNNGSDILLVQPWLFTDKVLQLWNENQTLIDQNKIFRWANVVPIVMKQEE
jgi:hypothetical protein